MNSSVYFLLKPLQDTSFEDISTLYTEFLKSEEYHALKRSKTSWCWTWWHTSSIFQPRSKWRETIKYISRWLMGMGDILMWLYNK